MGPSRVELEKKFFWIWFICTLEGCVLLWLYFFSTKCLLRNTLTDIHPVKTLPQYKLHACSFRSQSNFSGSTNMKKYAKKREYTTASQYAKVCKKEYITASQTNQTAERTLPKRQNSNKKKIWSWSNLEGGFGLPQPSSPPWEPHCLSPYQVHNHPEYGIYWSKYFENIINYWKSRGLFDFAICQCQCDPR